MTSTQPATEPQNSPQHWHAGLSAKEIIFVEHVVKGEPLAKAAQKAGYAKGHSYHQGSQMAKRPHVQAAIAKLMAKAAARIEISAEAVLQEVAAIAFSDLRNYATWGVGGVVIKESAQLGQRDARALAEVYDAPKRGKGVKLYDKLAALKLLGEYVGVFKKDTPPPNQPPVIKVYSGIDTSKV